MNVTAFDPTTELPLQFGVLPNPIGSQDYTIRVFNATSGCFTDDCYEAGLMEKICLSTQKLSFCNHFKQEQLILKQ